MCYWSAGKHSIRSEMEYWRCAEDCRRMFYTRVGRGLGRVFFKVLDRLRYGVQVRCRQTEYDHLLVHAQSIFIPVYFILSISDENV